MNITSNCKDLLLADRVERELLAEIASMAKRGQAKLPQQEELTKKYGVSIRTIRTVITRLKKRNLINSIKGKGMFLLPSQGAKGSFAEAVKPLKIAFNAKGKVEGAGNDISIYRDIYFQLLDELRERDAELVLTDGSDPRFKEDLEKADVIVEMDGIQAGSSAVKTPRVCVFFEEMGSFCVLPDNNAFGRKAVEILSGKGYKRIALCGHAGPADMERRLDAVLREFRRSAPEIRIEVVEMEPDSETKLGELLARPAELRPEALFILYGFGVMRAFKTFAKSGIQIPDSLAILGFDNFNFYSWLPIEVSRLYFPLEGIARGILYAIEDVARGRKPFTLVVPEVLYEEGATLPAAKGDAR